MWIEQPIVFTLLKLKPVTLSCWDHFHAKRILKLGRDSEVMGENGTSFDVMQKALEVVFIILPRADNPKDARACDVMLF